MNYKILFFRLFSYISYLIRAKSLHGVHSPFVCQLITRCIKPAAKTKFDNIEKLRQDLLGNHELIEVADFKNQTSEIRRISSIAMTSLSTRKSSSFLYHLANYLNAESGIETGTSLGINTLYLTKSSLKSVTTIERSQIIASLARNNISAISKKARVVNGDIYKVLEEEIARSRPDFYFLDADHHSSAIAFCIDLILKHTPQSKCIVIHDIYRSKDMKEIWQQLIQDPRFTLTIDLFQTGLLFPNLEMPKQHFTLYF
ncbi:MAG: hypothetical protein GDA51_12180 [Ekhidna sp.]|nr:hypothetical protein [Ekhidna sp.]MBC6410023.1 hypothetical protein [Ekhidna sp.]MBC6427192.1 hypothetical protein [Ekhidna sp.]